MPRYKSLAAIGVYSTNSFFMYSVLSSVFFIISKYNWYFGIQIHPQPKSLYISREDIQFYGTEFELWAGSGLVGSIENCPTYH